MRDNTRDLSKFGYRELDMARDLLKSLSKTNRGNRRMKPFITILLILFLAGCGTTDHITEQEYRETKKIPFSQAMIDCISPGQIGYWIICNIAYKADVKPEDEYRSVNDTITLGYGDCEDMAIVARHMLRDKGYEADLFTVSIAGVEAHCVCIFTVNGGIKYISNGVLDSTIYSSQAEIAKKIYANYTSYYLDRIN